MFVQIFIGEDRAAQIDDTGVLNVSPGKGHRIMNDLHLFQWTISKLKHEKMNMQELL